MAREDPQMKIRLPEALKAQVEDAALSSNRTLNAEIVTRLVASFTGDLAQRVQWVNDGLSERMEFVQAELNQQRALAQQFRSIADDSDNFRTLLASVLLSTLDKLSDEQLSQGLEGQIFRSVGEWLSDRDLRGAVFSILKLIERVPPELVENLQNFASQLEVLDLVNKPVVIQRAKDQPRQPSSVNKVIIVGNLGRSPSHETAFGLVSGRPENGSAPGRPAKPKGPSRSQNARKPLPKK